MKFPFFRSLTSQLVLSHLIVGACSVGLIASIAGFFIMQSGRREVENILEDTAFLISNDLEGLVIQLDEGESVPVSEFQKIFHSKFSNLNGLTYSIYLDDGTILATNDEMTGTPGGLPQEVATALKNTDSEAVHLNAAGKEAYYVAVPITHNGLIYGALRLNTDYETNLDATYHSLNLLWLISAMLLAGVGVGSWWFSRSFTQPIYALNNMAQQLSQGELQTRAVLQGPAELRQLAETTNQMAGRLQDNIASMRAFVDNASHELRTPLTAIRLHVDALADGAASDPEVSQRFLGQLQSEIERLSLMVTDLLDLSRIEANREPGKMELLDLGEVLSETYALWQSRSRQAGIDFRLTLPVAAPNIIGIDDQIRRLINNLVDNAIKNTPIGGWIELSLFNLSPKKSVRVEVRDSGKGIHAEHLPHIFERFYRVEMDGQSKPTGTGLGLAIAKSIVETHKGKIGVSSQWGLGSTFWVEFNQAATARSEDRNAGQETKT